MPIGPTGSNTSVSTQELLRKITEGPKLLFTGPVTVTKAQLLVGHPVGCLLAAILFDCSETNNASIIVDLGAGGFTIDPGERYHAQTMGDFSYYDSASVTVPTGCTVTCQVTGMLPATA